jgi:hypothetical protein
MRDDWAMLITGENSTIRVSKSHIHAFKLAGMGGIHNKRIHDVERIYDKQSGLHSGAIHEATISLQ